MNTPQAATRISHTTPTPNGRRCATPDQNSHSHRKAALAPCTKASNLPRSLAPRNVGAPGAAGGTAGSDAQGVMQARFESAASTAPKGNETQSMPGPGANPAPCAQSAPAVDSLFARSPSHNIQSAPAARTLSRKSTGYPAAYRNAASIAATDPKRSAGSNAVAWATTSRTDSGTPWARKRCCTVEGTGVSSHSMSPLPSKSALKSI